MTIESSGTKTITYVKTQFSEYYTIAESTLITTPIATTDKSGHLTTIDYSETIGPGGFGWFPNPPTDPNGNPILPTPPPSVVPTPPPSC